MIIFIRAEGFTQEVSEHGDRKRDSRVQVQLSGRRSFHLESLFSFSPEAATQIKTFMNCGGMKKCEQHSNMAAADLQVTLLLRPRLPAGPLSGPGVPRPRPGGGGRPSGGHCLCRAVHRLRKNSPRPAAMTEVMDYTRQAGRPVGCIFHNKSLR